jgi:hypothetical protein
MKNEKKRKEKISIHNNKSVHMTCLFYALVSYSFKMTDVGSPLLDGIHTNGLERSEPTCEI